MEQAPLAKIHFTSAGIHNNHSHETQSPDKTQSHDSWNLTKNNTIISFITKIVPEHYLDMDFISIMIVISLWLLLFLFILCRYQRRKEISTGRKTLQVERSLLLERMVENNKRGSIFDANQISVLDPVRMIPWTADRSGFRISNLGNNWVGVEKLHKRHKNTQQKKIKLLKFTISIFSASIRKA